MRRPCAPPEKTLALILLTLSVIRLEAVPLLLTQFLSGCWIFVLMFRRPMLCLLFQVFLVCRGKEDASADSMIGLTCSFRTEYLITCVLSPLAQACPRSGVGVMSDASPFAMGGTVTPVSFSESRDLWRHRERRGWWAPMSSRLSEFLFIKGLF